MGSLAVAAITATALSLFHVIDATAMILMWNVGTAALFMEYIRTENVPVGRAPDAFYPRLRPMDRQRRRPH